MLAKTLTVALWGLEVLPVTVESDIGDGLPRTHLVGKADKTVQESERRILTAFKHTGLDPPEGTLTINLSPSDLPKSGAHYDLPIAVSIALAGGNVPKVKLDRVLFMGELALDGRLRPYMYTELSEMIADKVLASASLHMVGS